MAALVVVDEPIIPIKKRELSDEFRSEFIINIQGKDYILYGGLITLAHAEGFKGFKPPVVVETPTKDNGGLIIVIATAVDKDGNEWSALGDGDNVNVGAKVIKHKCRVAETRAKGRALRDMLGIDILLIEEVDNPYAVESDLITDNQVNKIAVLMKQKKVSKEWMREQMVALTKKTKSAELTKSEASLMIQTLEAYTEDNE